MDDFNLKKYLAEGRLLKEEMSLEMGDDYVKLSTNSGFYGGDLDDDGTVSFSVVYYGEDNRNGRKFDRSNWKEMLGPDHAFVKISNKIPTEVEYWGKDHITVTVDLEDLKGISDSAEGSPWDTFYDNDDLDEGKLLKEDEKDFNTESINAINFITDTLKKVTEYKREGKTRYGFTIDEPNAFTIAWRDSADEDNVRWSINLELRNSKAVVYLNDSEGRGKVVLDNPEAFEILRTNIISRIRKHKPSSSKYDYDKYDVDNMLTFAFRDKRLK